MSCSRSRTRNRLAILATALLPFGVAAPSAQAAASKPQTRSLCVDKVTLLDSPAGYAIGYLHRPAKLAILDDANNHRWLLVRARHGVTGWIPKGALCPAVRR